MESQSQFTHIPIKDILCHDICAAAAAAKAVATTGIPRYYTHSTINFYLL